MVATTLSMAATRFFRPGDSGTALGSRDIVADFEPGEGSRLQHHFLYNLEFIGEDPFSAADQVRYSQSGGNTFVEIRTTPTRPPRW
jgi:hypothetical protein